jgi:hypothetical protein
MREFVVNNVVTGLRMAAAAQGCIPDNYYRSLLERLPDNGMLKLHWCETIFKETWFALRRNNGRGVDNDGFDIPVVVVGQAQKEQTGLSGDRDTDLVGKFQSTSSLPIFFGDKHLDQGTQVTALGIFQPAVVGNVTADYVLP